MEQTLNPSFDRRLAQGISLSLHALLLAFFVANFKGLPATKRVIFSVDTVSGLTPLGEGSGAEGASDKLSNTPANANPLANGLRLTASDAPVAEPKAKAVKAAAPKPVAARPSVEDVQKKYEGLAIGVKAREQRGAEDLSEGGMGNAKQAGTEDGVLGLQGAIAGRGFRTFDFSYNKPLPGESEVRILMTVNPKGEVIEARIDRTSGYPELDNHAMSKAREIIFDALPGTAVQENAVGTVVFKFDYSGRAISQP